MDISKLNKINIVMILAVLMQGCGQFSGAACDGGVSAIAVMNWSGDVPGKVILYRYEKGSSYTILDRVYEEGHGFTMATWAAQPNVPYLIFKMDNNERLPYGSDYRLIIDGRLEYRIHGVEEGIPTLGCALRAGWANQCSMRGFQEYAFKADCATPVSGAVD